MTTNNKPQIKLKLLIIGDSSVGKTSMLLSYTDNYFPESHLATIGVEYKVKEIQTDKYNISLQIWDTAGQERFRSITKSFFRNTNGIIFVYDITCRKSFQSVKEWIKDSELHDNGFEKILCGNKIDLKEKREVNFDELEEFGMKKKIEVMEISARERINIDEAFQKIINLILSNKTDKEIIDEFGIKNNNNDINLDKNNTKKRKQGCCGK
jgi:Ras-related protein Rab-1A